MYSVLTFMYYFLSYPFQILYLYGPELRGYGFWGGLSAPEVCSSLTGVSSIHWITLGADVVCEQLIERKMDAFFIGVLYSFIGIIGFMIMITWLVNLTLGRRIESTIRNVMTKHI